MNLRDFIKDHPTLNAKKLSKLIGVSDYKWNKIPYKYRSLLSKNKNLQFPLSLFKKPTDYGLAKHLKVSKQILSRWKKGEIPVAYRELASEFYQVEATQVPLMFTKKEPKYWKSKR